jgi:hypothetical protein
MNYLRHRSVQIQKENKLLADQVADLRIKLSHAEALVMQLNAELEALKSSETEEVEAPKKRRGRNGTGSGNEA